jgi:uncharacterized membrane protein YphA (DoxX/SURF4 family)
MNANRLIAVLRILFGVHFLFNGTNYIFHYVDIPKPPNEMANLLVDTMQASGLFWFAKGGEVLSGLMLITGQWVPLALMIAFPISVNILYVDVALTGVPFYAFLGILNFLWNAGLMYAYFKYYRPFLVRESTPGVR